ncbi:NAD-dependent malic enzyme [Candidatus Marinamargulisbacteria bacterium SCGC AG-439-L15]|nr:NAD-dependent malic enzyme [Candidatus Marinamargulisbacteria bacterium SCGC AG-439-L15]
MSIDIFTESVQLHDAIGGKLEVNSKVDLKDEKDLSLAYTPGIAGVCQEIERNPDRVYDLTIKKNSVAIVSDGSAVLGLGNIGAEASIPVMEGKALLFKEYAGIDAFPICIKSQNTMEIINLIKNIAPVFGGINLEDIAAPQCFEIEAALQDIGIPVFHDDQHGTAIVVLAAIFNAAKLKGCNPQDLKVVINGAGAAGSAIADLLLRMNVDDGPVQSVKEILICDSQGIISETRPDVAEKPAKLQLARRTNRKFKTGSIEDAMKGADVFLGVSVANAVTKEMVKSMAKDPIILAMANPIPEIMPDDAKEAGAFIVGTGRSDFQNQVNNVLAFPGIFRGAMDKRAKRITRKMKIAAAHALANAVKTPKPEKIIPSVLDKGIAYKVAEEVAKVYDETT